MYRVKNKNIYLTRGDSCKIEVVSDSGSFHEDDTLTLYITKAGDITDIVFQKTITIISNNSVAYIPLTAEETLIGDPIKNGERTYWYQIKKNDEDTITGYDEDGAKLFILWPSADTE